MTFGSINIGSRKIEFDKLDFSESVYSPKRLKGLANHLLIFGEDSPEHPRPGHLTVKDFHRETSSRIITEKHREFHSYLIKYYLDIGFIPSARTSNEMFKSRSTQLSQLKKEDYIYGDDKYVFLSVGSHFHYAPNAGFLFDAHKLIDKGARFRLFDFINFYMVTGHRDVKLVNDKGRCVSWNIDMMPRHGLVELAQRKYEFRGNSARELLYAFFSDDKSLYSRILIKHHNVCEYKDTESSGIDQPEILVPDVLTFDDCVGVILNTMVAWL